MNYSFTYTIYWKIAVLSNYNIKYVCTICKCLDTCHMSISWFSLRDKVTLRVLKLYFYGADVVEWSRALDIMLSYWCCSVSMMWVQISYTLLCVCMYAMACILLTNYTELLILKNALHFFSTVGKHFSDMTFKMAIYYFLKQRYVHNAHKHTLW